MEWLSLSNAAYMLVIILGALGTMAAVRYRPLIKEVKEVAQKYHDAKRTIKYQRPSNKKLQKKQWMSSLP